MSPPAPQAFATQDGAATFERVLQHARDPRCGFSLGVLGAIAEFLRTPGAPCALDAAPGRLSLITELGAMGLEVPDAARLLAYATPSRHEARRHRALAVCLPRVEAAMAGRGRITALGPDTHALRPQDRSALLFDLGLGTPTLDALVRTADPQLIARLAAAAGTPLFESAIVRDLLAASPHRVFVSRLGRIEVFTPIPAPDGRSPDGPHTHILPALLAHGRTHAASLPIPDGYVPCLGIHPPPEDGAAGRA